LFFPCDITDIAYKILVFPCDFTDIAYKILVFPYMFVGEKNPILSSFITYHEACNISNTMGGTSGAEAIYFSGEPQLSPVL
jgi:hypothetical protein